MFFTANGETKFKLLKFYVILYRQKEHV